MAALKKFGLGILWALLFPLILAGVAVVGVFGVLDFLVEFVIMIINFFRGKKLFPAYPEDEKAYAILKRAIDKKNGELSAQNQPAPAPQQVFVQQNFYTNPGAVPPGAIPPTGAPTAIPGYGQPSPYANPYGTLPNQQPGVLPNQQPGVLPNQQPNAQPPMQQQPAMPPRPELAKLPEFNPADYHQTTTQTIDIDVDGGEEE